MTNLACGDCFLRPAAASGTVGEMQPPCGRPASPSWVARLSSLTAESFPAVHGRTTDSATFSVGSFSFVNAGRSGRKVSRVGRRIPQHGPDKVHDCSPVYLPYRRGPDRPVGDHSRRRRRQLTRRGAAVPVPGLFPSERMEPETGSATVNGSGRLAQLGERLPYKQEVAGSNPAPPTVSAQAVFVLSETACACRAGEPLRRRTRREEVLRPFTRTRAADRRATDALTGSRSIRGWGAGGVRGARRMTEAANHCCRPAGGLCAHPRWQPTQGGTRHALCTIPHPREAGSGKGRVPCFTRSRYAALGRS
jgi:hypothetical protein